MKVTIGMRIAMTIGIIITGGGMKEGEGISIIPETIIGMTDFTTARKDISIGVGRVMTDLIAVISTGGNELL